MDWSFDLTFFLCFLQQAPKAESRQFDALQHQFDQAVKHLRNHVDELQAKILSVVEAILQQQVRDPFKDLLKTIFIASFNL